MQIFMSEKTKVYAYIFSVWKFAFCKSVTRMGVCYISTLSFTTGCFGELFLLSIYFLTLLFHLTGTLMIVFEEDTLMIVMLTVAVIISISVVNFYVMYMPHFLKIGLHPE